MDNVNVNVSSSQTFLVYNFSPNSSSKGGRRREEGEGCECQSHVEARKCPRPTPLSGRVPSCGFCKMLADHTAPREQASLDYLSPPFQLSNWKWRHAGRSPPGRSPFARFPHDSTLQMRVTFDKSFRTSGEPPSPSFPSYFSPSLAFASCADQ